MALLMATRYCGFMLTPLTVIQRSWPGILYTVVGGCPSLVRTDCGTENVVIAGVPNFLRAEFKNDLAGERAHRHGPSTVKPMNRGLVVLFLPKPCHLVD